MSGGDRDALEVIARIYDAALEPSAWEAALAGVVRFVGGSKGLLFTPLTGPHDGGFAIPWSIPQSMLELWGTRYVEHDVWAKAGERQQAYRDGNVVLDADLVPEPEFLRSVVYRELLAPVGIARLCCGIVFGMASPGLPPTVCSVFRNVREPAFRDAERRRLGMLVPHLSRAFGVVYRLRDAELKIAATHAALDRLATGVVLVGERRQLIFANGVARTILAAREPLRLARGGGADQCLAATTHAKSAEIDAALAATLGPAAIDVPHFSVGVRVPRVGTHDAIVLNVSALPGNGLGGGADVARAIVFLTDTAKPVFVDTGLLKRVYSLSDAETRVVEQLCAGGDLMEVAGRLGVSHATVRTQLQNIFAKTGTRRQAELVRLVVSLSSH